MNQQDHTGRKQIHTEYSSSMTINFVQKFMHALRHLPAGYSEVNILTALVQVGNGGTFVKVKRFRF